MIQRRAIYIRLFAIGIFLLPFLVAGGQVHLPAGSTFRYLKGINAASLDAGWMNPGFNDSQWSSGSAPFRYGDGTGGTLLSDMQNTYSVVYLRTTFTATNIELLDQLHLTVDYDDGFVVWINGQKILSQNAPLILSPDAFALDFHESGVPEDFYFEPGSINLNEGENTLAVQAFNISLESTDFLINVGMSAEIPEQVFQDTIGLQFSNSSGFYTQPFSLQIIPSNPAWNVYYTLDGSNPQYSETAMVSPGGATIQVDPRSTVNRDATPAVVVRASAGTGGITPSYPEARTYIFTNEVLTQSYPGGEWPDYNVNDQIIDLEMDGDVVNHASYKNLMVPSLKDVPSLSLITDIDNLFDSQIGIYVNAYGHGYEWERECAAELIQPDGSEGFNVNAGLRIRGGWSRHEDFPKHSFRLFFRAEYGDPKLDFPLFGEEGVDSYDKIDIRTSQNYAWSTGDSRNTMLRDVFSRDTQRDMGQPYTRSRYYHLYLNGMYWGLFQTQERSEARFAADYLGGDAEDYDVIKVNTEDWYYRIEATDGDFTLWYEIWNMCQAGFSSGEAYKALEGKDSEGKPLAGGQVYVDIDNLIDYMLSIFYTGNFDAPTSSFMSNRGPNNFFAINDRTDLSTGFTFYNHDAEHSMFSEPASPGVGLYEDRVNLNMSVSDFSVFHPQWLHDKLTDNSDYRVRFMDRAHQRINVDGVLSPEKNLERLNSRIDEMESAIIAESARWGDAKRASGSPYTKDDHWIPEVNKIVNDFIPFRTSILIDQLKEAGLYSELESPQVFQDGIPLEEKMVPVSGPSSLVIKNPNSSSTIYYTTDGTDPRISGGGISPEAISGGSSQVSVNFTGSGILKSRIHFGGDWSALKEVNLVSDNEDYSNLVITEIHYHPDYLVMDADTIDGKDFEFIEFKNIGNNPIALGGLILDSAVYYEFPAESILAPGQFHVVVSKPSKFYLRYGMAASGNFQKNFSNGGEDILLKNPDGIPLIWFTYSDDPPWPYEPDGLGYSLVSAERNPTGNPAMATYWAKSYHIGGSPFADEPFPASGGPVIQNSGELRVYPNPASDILNIELPGTDTEQQATITLYGINGNLLYREVIYGNSTLQLSGLNLTPGVYLIRVQTLQGLYTRKIIFR
jgi:hypothetical protein